MQVQVSCCQVHCEERDVYQEEFWHAKVPLPASVLHVVCHTLNFLSKEIKKTCKCVSQKVRNQEKLDRMLLNSGSKEEGLL